jgi:enoyl-CoA hydratase
LCGRTSYCKPLCHKSWQHGVLYKASPILTGIPPAFARDGHNGVVSIETIAALGLITLSSEARQLQVDELAAVATAYTRWQNNPDIYCAVVRISGTESAPRATVTGSSVAGVAASHHLVWQVDRFAKPAVALVNAAHGGIGLGLTAFGTHRVAGEDYAVMVDALRHGGLPGLGQTVALARLPGHLGAFHALTGRPIDRVTAYRWGLVSHLIAARHFPAIEAALSRADCVDPLLDALHDAAAARSAAGPLAPYEGVIEQTFDAETLDEVVTALRTVDGAERAWARKTADALSGVDPALADATLALLRRATPADLRTRLNEDMRACLHAVAQNGGNGVHPLQPAQWLSVPAAGEEALPIPPAIPTAPAAQF